MKTYFKEIILLCLISFILYISYRYADLKYEIFYEYAFWDNLINYKEINFYQYCLNEWEKFGFSAGACYSQWGMALHFILGIWGAPIFIYSNVFHASIYELLKCFGTIIYGKGILILFLLMTMIVILKICKIVYGNNNPSSIIEIVLVFLSSYFIFAPIYIQGQCDIIEIFFLLLGLYFYISKSKKIFYIIVFMISVSLKQVSILFIIPFLVLIEKNIAKIFFSLGVILAPTLLNKILWGGPINVSVNVSNIEGLLLNAICAARRPLVRLPAATRRSPTATFIKGFR